MDCDRASSAGITVRLLGSNGIQRPYSQASVLGLFSGMRLLSPNPTPNGCVQDRLL